MAEAYRLAALLQLRERAREEAEHDLARAQASQTKAEQHLEATQRFEAMCRAKVDEGRDQLYSGEGLTIGLIQNREQFLKRLVAEHEDAEGQVRQAEQGVAQAKEKVREANEALVLAKQEEEALIKHREKWEKEQKTIKRRREEDEADDIAQTMWRNKS